MSKGLNLPSNVEALHLTHGIVDDFYAKDTNIWTTTATDSGTVTVADAVGGVAPLVPSDGTVADNDEVYLLTKEVFKIAAGKPLQASCRIQFTEANTDDANVAFGLMDAVAANSIVDNGAGLKTSFSGACFYKVDGGTRWQVIYSDGATQTTADLSATNSLTKSAQSAGGASYQTLQIDIIPKTSTLVDVVFSIDGSTVYKMLDKTYASATEMSLFVGAKNGGANNETINVDSIRCHQKR